MKGKQLLYIPALIVAVAMIWTVNFILFRSIQTSTTPTDHDVVLQFSVEESLSVSTFTFKPLKRDPFNVVVDTVPYTPMPRCILRGVVLTGEGAVALMELSDGNIYPMKKGEVYKGVKIKNITSEQVILQFRGRSDTLLIMP